MPTKSINTLGSETIQNLAANAGVSNT
jgi:uncharacterized protein YidB (DUF937 family)